MKRNFIMIVAAAVAILAVWSCRKGAESPETGDSSKISISVTAEMEDLGGCDAKASIGTVYRLSWTAGDKVFVYDGEKRLGDLTVSLNKDSDSRYAYLTGYIGSKISGNVLTCVYAKGIKTAPEVDENGEVKFSMASQTPGDTPFVVYGTIDYSTGQTSITDKLVNFEFATAVVLVNCLDLATDGGDVTKAELSGINTNCVLSLSGTDAPDVVEDTEVGTITTTSTPGKEFQSGNGKLTYQIGIPVSDAVILTENPAAQRKLIITQASKQMSTNFTSSAFAAGKFKNVIYTLEEYTPPTPPADGSLPGVFSVSATKKVKFSQGNLQYQASTNTWRFAEHQYDHVGDGGTKAGNVEGSDNTQISATYPGWIDLFGWATSGYDDYRKTTEKPYPYNYDGSSANYKINGGAESALTIEHYTDWGVNNIKFFDGEKYVEGKPASGWRTLKGAEWNYVIGATGDTHREDECRYMLCKCSESIYGVLIFPDDWTIEDWPDNSGNKPTKDKYNVNTAKSLPSLSISLELLGKLQEKGVVFLPQTGYRTNQTYYFNNTTGGSNLLYYWAADGSTGAYTYYLMYEASTIADLNDFKSTTSGKNRGHAVRLVTDVSSDSN